MKYIRILKNTIIDDIGNHGYIVYDEEETKMPIDVFDESLWYSIPVKTYDNLDVAYEFYNEYGLLKGFGIQKHLLNRQKNTNEIYKKQFVCNKQAIKI